MEDRFDPRTSDPRPPPSARPGPRRWARPAFWCLRHAASGSPPPAPAAESTSPRTSGSRSCTGCSSDPSRTPSIDLPVHPRRTLVRLDLLPRLPDRPLRNLERLARRLQLVHATPPGPNGPVDRTNTATDDPAPSLHPHYRGFTTTTSRSASAIPHRYSIPHGFGRSGHSLSPTAHASGQYRVPPSPVPCESRRPGSRRLHAGHRLANKRAPARLIPGSHAHPGFDVICSSFDTSAAIRLRSPSRSPPDASHDAFSSSLTTTVFSQRSMRWFEASPRRAAPKGRNPSSSAQHRFRKLYLHRLPLHVQDTRPAKTSPSDCGTTTASKLEF